MTTEKTRGRKPLNTTVEQVGPEFTGGTPADLAEQERRVNRALAESHDNAHALAAQLGYEGGLSVGALEDEIRFYQRRSVEACLELGKRLLILKELTPHGEFGQRLQLLDINPDMGQKFMASTLKFSKAAAPRLLASAGNQSKLLELLTLDDGEMQALESGDTVRGITLDEVDTMSSRELRAALREAKSDIASKAEVLAETSREAEALREEKAKRTRYTPAQQTREAAALRESRLRALKDAALSTMSAMHQFGIVLADVMPDATDGELAMQAARWLAQQLSELYAAHGIDVNFDDVINPPWLQAGGVAAQG